MTLNPDGWHAENIKAELRKRFGTARIFAQQHGLSPQSVSDVLAGPFGPPRVELAIAKAIGVPPHELWPTRWTPEGLKIDRAQFRVAKIVAAECP